jgi:hypothetical protein
MELKTTRVYTALFSITNISAVQSAVLFISVLVTASNGG